MESTSLDFGKLNGKLYENELLGWSLTISEDYIISLKSQSEREELLKMYKSERLVNSKEELEKRSKWTELLSINDQEVSLFCEIRKVLDGEIVDLDKLVTKQISAFVESDFIAQDFEYARDKKIIKGIEFRSVEFNEVNYIKGNNFTVPFIKLFGIINGILIRLVLSSYNMEKRDLLLKDFTNMR